MIAVALITANLAALISLLRFGAAPERWACLALALVVLTEPWLETYTLGTWRYGLLLSNAALFLTLWLLAERYDRWWLIMAAGFQAITVLSHMLPVISDSNLTWSLVTIRIVVWSLISATLFLGALEAALAKRYLQDTRNGTQNRRPDDVGAIPKMESSQTFGTR